VVLTTQVKLQVAPMKMGKKIPKRVKFDYTTKHEKKSTEVKPIAYRDQIILQQNCYGPLANSPFGR